MGKVKWFAGITILLIVLAVSISACGGGESRPKSPTPEKKTEQSELKILRMNAAKYSTLDPQQCNDVGCALYVDEIYSGLLTLTLVPKAELNAYVQKQGLPMISSDVFSRMPILWQEWAQTYLKQHDSMEIVLAPDIAKEIPEPVYNSNGTVSYTFNLRDNVYFHNDKHVTAHDFKFSFERAASPNWPDRSSAFTLPTADLYLSDILCVREIMFGEEEEKEVCGVEVLDDYTLRITIDAPKSYFLWKLTYPTAFVIDKDKIVNPVTGEVQKEDWTDPPNGTGPFRAIPGNEQTRLIANDSFYLGRPFLDEVVLNHQGGQNIIFAYDAGDVDIAGVGIDYLRRVREGTSNYNPEFAQQYRSGSSLDVFYVTFNTEKPPFDDILVRRAFAMAVNKLDLETIGDGLFIPARGIVPPGIDAYDANFAGIPFDPTLAKQLLQQSRYWGTDVLNKVELLRGGSGPEAGPVTEAILDMWRKYLDIKVILDEPATGQVYQNRIIGGDYQIAVSGWIADYPDAEDFLDLKLYCNRIKDPITNRDRCERDYANNQARYYNAEFDRIIREARTERNPAHRVELYREAERIAIEEAPWIPLVHTRSSVAVKPHVLGYYPSPLIIPQFRFIDIKR